LEHPAATSLLPLARISKSFCCKIHAQHPNWQHNVNNSKLVKSKGNSAFP
jgi:hypothetical protein